MSKAIKLTDAVGYKGVLLDTNVLPHFLSGKTRKSLEQFGVGYKPAARRFEGVKARFEGKLFTSVVNVVECLAEVDPSAKVAKALVTAFTNTARVCFPMPVPQLRVLPLYAEHGESFSKAWSDRVLDAQFAIEEVWEKWGSVWASEAEAKGATDLLKKLVAPYAIRDRGWADIYTAQTAIDHKLIVLTEDVSDFKPIQDVDYLTDYDMSGQ